MSDTIEDIVIQIESDSSDAVSQLDILTERLQGLKKATANSSVLATFSKNFEMMNRSLTFLNNLDPRKAATIHNMASAASSFKGITISKSIGEGITNINTSLNALSEANMAKLSDLANTMFLLKEMQGFRYPSSINTGLQKTAELAENIKDADFTKLKELVDTVTQLGKLSVEDSGAVKELANSMKVLTTETKQANTHGRKFNTVLGNIKTKTMGLYIVANRVLRGATKTLSVYGDYVEALNLYKMAMGGAAEEGYKFAETAQKLLGIDLTQWMQAQGVFMALAKGFGVAEEKAALMSQNLTQLAYDISSFYNISVEDAIQKVQSGFSGQIRPVRNLGYDLSQARLEAIALANGIDEEVKSMTQAEKSQLRYVALMTQLTEVQGDLARTLDSPTNQLRLLNAQLDQMTRSIGMVLLPILNKVIPYLNAVFRVIKMIAEEIAAMFGYTLPKIANGDWSQNVSIGADELEDDLNDATGAAEKLKNTLASFDQINLITSTSSGSGSGSGATVGGSDLGLDLPSYDFLGDVNENKAQQIADNIMKNIRPVVDFIKDFIKFCVDHIDTIVQMIETFAAVTIGKNLIGQVVNLFGLTKKEMEGVNKFLSGAAIMTIGIQFAYLGGKDIGMGNTWEGLIKSALGIGAATLGGFRMAGPAGAVMGFTLSLAFTIDGFFDGKDEALKQKCHELFYSIEEDAKSLDRVKDSWNNWVGALSNPELIDKYNVGDKLRDDVLLIGQSIGELQAQYIAGNITASGYAQTLVSLYSQLEETATKHLKAVDDALIESLNGPLGLYMQAQGYDVEGLISAFTKQTDDFTKKLEENRLKLQEYEHFLNEGIQVDYYKKKMDEVLKENEQLYKSMNFTDDATKGLFKSFKDIKINFEDPDKLIETLNEIQSSYEGAIKELNTLENEYVAGMREKLADPSITAEQKKQYEESIRLAQEYYQNQRDTAGAGLRDLLASFEESGMIHWDKVVNGEGLDNAIKYTFPELGKIEEKLREMYGDDISKRADNYWHQMFGNGKEMIAMSKLLDKTSFDLTGAVSDRIGDVTKSYEYETLKRKESVGKLTMLEKQKLAAYEQVYGKTTDVIKQYVNDGSYYESLYTANAQREMEERMYHWENGNYIFDGQTQQTAAIYKRLGDTFGDSSILVDPLTETMYETAQVLTNADLKNSFKTNSMSLLNGMAQVFADPNNQARKALLDGLEISSSIPKEIGKSFGEGIANGMNSSRVDVVNAVNNVTKGMANGFNKFGDGLADYLNAISNSVTGTLNGLNIGFSSSNTSQFVVKRSDLKVKGYASGGFPNSADFFYANENGVPEYVGTMGGRAAVANNQEITKGVADGVYKAIKDTGLITDVKKIAGKSGKVVFAPSEEAGKVMSQSVGMYNGTGGRY